MVVVMFIVSLLVRLVVRACPSTSNFILPCYYIIIQIGRYPPIPPLLSQTLGDTKEDAGGVAPPSGPLLSALVLSVPVDGGVEVRLGTVHVVPERALELALGLPLHILGTLVVRLVAHVRPVQLHCLV